MLSEEASAKVKFWTWLTPGTLSAERCQARPGVFKIAPGRSRSFWRSCTSEIFNRAYRRAMDQFCCPPHCWMPRLRIACLSSLTTKFRRQSWCQIAQIVLEPRPTRLQLKSALADLQAEPIEQLHSWSKSARCEATYETFLALLP